MRMVLCAVALTLMLGGCTYLSSLGVYKLDINQGNYVTQDQVDKLKVGQTRQQVRIALGTPLVTDAFHANRWDGGSAGWRRRRGARQVALDRAENRRDDLAAGPAQKARLVAIRLCIAGASGRMGQALLETALSEPDVLLTGALDVAASPLLGREVGERFGHATGVMVSADIPTAVAGADVLIDFTRPEGTLAHVAACARAGVAAVVGTTGLSTADKRALAHFGKAIAIVFAPNMSV